MLLGNLFQNNWLDCGNPSLSNVSPYSSCNQDQSGCKLTDPSIHWIFHWIRFDNLKQLRITTNLAFKDCPHNHLSPYHHIICQENIRTNIVINFTAYTLGYARKNF